MHTAKQGLLCTPKGAIVERKLRVCFGWFRGSNFNLEERQRSGKSAVVDDSQLETLVNNKPSHKKKNISEIIKISQMCAKRHFKTFET